MQTQSEREDDAKVKIYFSLFLFYYFGLFSCSLLELLLLLLLSRLHFHRVGQCFSRFSRVFFILYAFCVNFLKILHDYLLG